MFCSDIFNFTYDSNSENISSDLDAMICSFATLIYPLIYDPLDPFVHWAYVLEMSQVSDEVMQAFSNNKLNFTINPKFVTFDCNGSVNLTVSYAESECGYVTCPYRKAPSAYGPFDILVK